MQACGTFAGLRQSLGSNSLGVDLEPVPVGLAHGAAQRHQRERDERQPPLRERHVRRDAADAHLKTGTPTAVAQTCANWHSGD